MEIKLYSIGCPKCNILHKKLDAKNIQYELITDDDAIMAVSDKCGIRSLPLLEVDDKIMDFTEANKWVNAYE